MKEREINIFDLCFEILLRWRVIIVWMLVGGVVLGSFSYMRSYRRVEAQKAQNEEMQKKLEEQQNESPTDEMEILKRQLLEEQLDAAQIASVNVVIEYEKDYANTLNYINNSVYMKLDANAVPKAELTFIIKAADYEDAYNIEKAYEDFVTSGSMYSFLANKLDMTESAVVELLGLEKSSYTLQEGSNLLRIQVLNETEKTCKDMAALVSEYLAEKQSLLAETMGEHELILLDDSYVEVTSLSIMSNQQKYYSELNSLESQIAKAKAEFTQEQLDYYNCMSDTAEAEINENGEDAQTEAQGGEVKSASVSIRYVVLGAFLFAFMYIFFVLLSCIMNNKLQLTDDLTKLFDIPQLGTVALVKKKKVFDFVDKWIVSLRDRNKRKFSTEEAVKLAAVAVKIAAKKNGFSTVYLIGCSLKEDAMNLCKQIQEIAQKDGITVKIVEDILYNAEALDKLSEAKGAVLIEQAGSALYQEIVKERDLLVRQDIMVLGGIIEG